MFKTLGDDEVKIGDDEVKIGDDEVKIFKTFSNSTHVNLS